MDVGNTRHVFGLAICVVLVVLTFSVLNLLVSFIFSLLLSLLKAPWFYFFLLIYGFLLHYEFTVAFTIRDSLKKIPSIIAQLDIYNFFVEGFERIGEMFLGK